MRIEPTGLPPIRTSQNLASRAVDKSSESEVAATETFEPTSELARLLATVRELPDVREDLVQSINERLLTGEFSTSAAADETAKAMLSGPGA